MNNRKLSQTAAKARGFWHRQTIRIDLFYFVIFSIPSTIIHVTIKLKLENLVRFMIRNSQIISVIEEEKWMKTCSGLAGRLKPMAHLLVEIQQLLILFELRNCAQSSPLGSHILFGLCGIQVGKLERCWRLCFFALEESLLYLWLVELRRLNSILSFFVGWILQCLRCLILKHRLKLHCLLWQSPMHFQEFCYFLIRSRNLEWSQAWGSRRSQNCPKSKPH